jgi:macrolide transport system ATP-binding/permease protein
VRSAEEKLARLEAEALPEPPAPLQFVPIFHPDEMSGRFPLSAHSLHKTYDVPILQDVTLEVPNAARILLVGENGAGKSTLLRILAGVEAADTGSVYRHPKLRIGYLPQGTDDLNPEQTLYECYRTGQVEEDRVLKARFLQLGLFRLADLDVQVGALSSGQQRKLQLARLIAQRANLLILDEPTNHLSFDVLEAFEAALRLFPGAVIAASHDRRFMAQFDGAVYRVGEQQLTQLIRTV